MNTAMQSSFAEIPVIAACDICRSHLGSFGISGDLALQAMYTLSGGQKSRVAFAKVSLLRDNRVLLDSLLTGRHQSLISFISLCHLWALKVPRFGTYACNGQNQPTWTVDKNELPGLLMKAWLGTASSSKVSLI